MIIIIGVFLLLLYKQLIINLLQKYQLIIKNISKNIWFIK